tara:strand:- start:201 stop:446 length:246 start_codon:yes stop_codon:yes gene_type:complete
MSFEVTLKGDQTLDSIDIDIMLYIRSWCRDVLQSTDWTQLPDSPLSAEDKEKYRVFRQKVRDLPAKYNDDTKLDEIEWPSP